jgi:hypothetical protein
MIKRLLFFGIFGAAIFAVASQNDVLARTEQPKYKVVSQRGDIEIRDYDATVVAEVEIAGAQHYALETGFRVLAGYIFGKNQSNDTYTSGQTMSSSVSMQRGEKIAMTAPVSAEPHGSVWKIRFTMPSQYSLATLPQPKDKRITLFEVPASRMAAIRFSGIASAADMDKKAEELETFLIKNNMKSVGEAVQAYYNPPWTLPMFRRNEVLFKVADLNQP